MSVRDRLTAGDFKNKIPFPSKPAKPRLVSNANPTEVRRYADELELYTELYVQYDEGIRAYHRGENKAIAEFEEALADENGMTNHPKRQKVWAMAWEHGHSGGLDDVLYWYDELSELVL